MSPLTAATRFNLSLLVHSIFLTTVIAKTPDFARCERILNETGDKFLWTGHPSGLTKPAPDARLYTYEGCLEKCGDGYEMYSWSKIADTITTWVLPSVGLLLQAPWESNVPAWKGLFLAFRWIGNPIASMTCTLWNISVTAKSALLVDMATHYDLKSAFSGPEAEATFQQVRDSFYLLSVLNQFTFCIADKLDVDLARLLRFALFDPSPAAAAERKKLASTLRRQRKRGVVQVMITLFWFVVVLIVSVHRAFKVVGSNTTAHDLALGLLLGWLAVLIASTVVDRNPTDSQHTRRKLNAFLTAVQRNNPGRFDPADISTEVFKKFAGQGRLRWHYGAAHCLLEGLEDDHLKARGRGWIELYSTGTLSEFTRDHYDLAYFDIRQLWHAAFSLLLHSAACFGAFWISFNTPTVGLGCRSGGYMIFAVLSIFALVLELVSWPFINRAKMKKHRVALHRFMVLLEAANTTWLAYIIMAQTFGFYKSCRCMTARWGGAGGYMDFGNTKFYLEHYAITLHWITGTVVGMLSLGIGLGYVLEQWLTQGFLWAEDWGKAKCGLAKTRQWRRITLWSRRGGRWVIGAIRGVIGMIMGRNYNRAEGRSVRWEP